MKKIIVLSVFLFSVVASFAVPAWDRPLHKIKITKPSPAFDPPIYVDFQMSIVSGGWHDNLRIYFEMDHTVTYTVHAVIDIYGWWYDTNVGWYEGMKAFDWSIAPGLLWNTKYDMLWPGEQPNLDWYIIDSFS